jgi:hypothetical protein
MSRRQSSSDAIDIEIEPSTDLRPQNASGRAALKWRAPRPASWAPPLPPHRIPASVPPSAPRPALQDLSRRAPALRRHGYVEEEVVAPRARLWPWALLVLAAGAGAAGFVEREPLALELTTAASWVRGQLPGDLAERPRVALGRAREILAFAVARARSLVQPPARVAPPSEASPSAPTGPETAEVGSVVTAPPELPVVAVSSLPVAPAPPPAPRPAAMIHPRAAAPKPSAVISQSEPPASPPTATPVETSSEPPPSSPAPEPGSLDDLIRRAVEKERRQQH